MSKFVLSLFLFLSAISFVKVNSIISDDSETNYCDPAICEFQPGGHIGCNSTGAWSKRCSKDRELVSLEKDKKDYILHLHNGYRNTQALGQQKGFLPASRMPTLRWNTELAYLCELNVKTCDNNHDFCHNTKNFRFSGQNLGSYSSNIRYMEVNEFINNMIGGWYTEHLYANQTSVDRCCSRGPENKAVGHFTQLTMDRVSEVGCAISKFQTEGVNNNLLLCCNYDSANLVGYSSYKTGPTASLCNRGSNPLYPGLCHESENVNPNMIF